MPKIKMEIVVEHLQVQFQGVRRDVIKELKLQNVTERDLLRSFQKAAKLRCSTWETVPDSAIDSY